jgi:hypothetical protein
MNPRGFRSVRVECTIRDVTWRTSVFPQKRRLFPAGENRRVPQGGDCRGDDVTVELELL